MSLRTSLGFTPRAPLAATVALLLAGAAGATPRPLADDEMSAVRGADNSIVAGLQGDASNPFSSGLAAAFSSSTGPTLLTPAEFAASLEAAGYSLAMLPGYTGGPVAQLRVDAKPITFSFDLSDVLRATTGLQVNGPSMGTIVMRDFDARGTTIWTWNHH